MKTSYTGISDYFLRLQWLQTRQLWMEASRQLISKILLMLLLKSGTSSILAFLSGHGLIAQADQGFTELLKDICLYSTCSFRDQLRSSFEFILQHKIGIQRHEKCYLMSHILCRKSMMKAILMITKNLLILPLWYVYVYVCDIPILT